jgi:nickel/cobalt transporter (NicO) family protein
MFTRDIIILAGTAAVVGFVHTIFGPDHYIPFVAMSRARHWTMRRTMLISFLCGLGHVLSSVVLGLVGIALGIAVGRLTHIEAVRGGIAGWLMIIFGFAYLVWGLHRLVTNRPHTHVHYHADGHAHDHTHDHHSEHAHPHIEEGKATITPWILFTIFVFGPCEPLIPLVMYPAAKHSLAGVALVAATFSIATIGTMLTVIALSVWGFNLLRLGRLERYVHVLAGAMIFVSGLAVQILGL